MTESTPPPAPKPSAASASLWWGAAFLLVFAVVISSLRANPPASQTQPQRTVTGTAAPSRTSTQTRPATLTPLQPQAQTATKTQTPTATATLLPTHTATALPSATATLPPAPPAPPTPTPLPPQAEVEGMFGYGQQLPLSCESRSAADWARHFGVTIHELEFFDRLPQSADDPEEGFVGNVYGSWGQLPPNPYGVHAQPVAALLREYGVAAQAVKQMAFNDLLAEVAAGRPVMVWITGHTTPGQAVSYTVNDKTILVARHQHTVIVIGYNEERDRVTILDGAEVYQRTYETFLQSWAALDQMAVIAGY